MSKVKSEKSKVRGFTLIELILYIALLTTFIVGAVLFAWDVIYSREKSSIQQELNNSLRFASKRISFEIRSASSVNSVTSSSISLAVSDAARSPTVIDLSSGRIRIGFGSAGSCPTSAPCFLTSNDVSIANLAFTDLSSGNSVNINFSITGEITGVRAELQASQTIAGSGEVRSN